MNLTDNHEHLRPGNNHNIMPWKGLKLGGGQKGGAERSQKANSAAVPRLSEQGSRAIHSSGHLSPRVRESLALPNKLPSASLDHGERTLTGSPERIVRAQNTKRNRFSLLRFRHASDSQLSVSYQEGEPPPVPPIPENAQREYLLALQPSKYKALMGF